MGEDQRTTRRWIDEVAFVEARVIRLSQPVEGSDHPYKYSLALVGGKRWEILEALAGQGEIGVRELARRLEREVKSVHRDTESLVAGGVIEKTDQGKLVFPYSRIVLEPLVFDSAHAA